MNDTNSAAAAESTTSAVAHGTIIEERWLGNNEPIDQAQTDRELAELGEGWQLESAHQAFDDVCYDGYKNQHDALSRNENRKAGYYRTRDDHPRFPGARVVVGFGDGYVYDGYYDNHHARARAVRVAGQ